MSRAQAARLHAALALTLALSTAGRADAAPPWVSLAGGRHLRIDTERGAVHVFRPRGYARETAGILVYVHGYFTDVDQAFTEHRLAEQFASSLQNALFIVPEAPANKQDEVRFPDLGALIALVEREGNITRPDGPLVVLGHSGAYRTVVEWLGFRRVDEVILLDALYAHEDDFIGWVERAAGHAANRLIIVSTETRARSEAMLDRLPFAARSPEIPPRIFALSRSQRNAQVLYLPSQYDHMALVTSEKVLPVLLRLTPFRRLAPSR